MISLTDTQKIGMGLTGFGVFFLFFGMILFFDKALLAIGNIMNQQVCALYTLRAILNDPRGFFPVVIGFIRRVPVLGYLLNLPGISSLVDKAGESNNMV
ncbi:hypothetical protein Chor_009811 [Crotalus horridus]